jgi:hemolysin activation/secretion protein
MGGMMTVAAHAQNNDPRLVPKPPPPIPDQSWVGSVEPPISKSPKQEDQLLIPDLKGIVLIDSLARLQKNGVASSGVMAEGLPMLDDSAIRDQLAAFIGKPVTQSTLSNINQAIIVWYRDKHYPFVDVAAPAGQDVTNGVIQIVVTESRAGKVTARGNRWFSSDFLIGQVRLAPGERVNILDLEEDKNWINQNPFRLVNIVANRSDTPGVTDFVVDTVQEKFPVRVFAGYANDGTPILGHDRWTLGLNWGNALWADWQFNYQFTSSDDFWHSREKFVGKPDNPSFTGHTASLEIPLPWRDKLKLYGYYLQVQPLFGASLLGVNGTDASAGLRYVTRLPSTRKFDEHLEFGFEYKSSNNNLAFGGFPIIPQTATGQFIPEAQTTEIGQFLIEYDATERDNYGQTDFTNTLVYSPGGIFSHSKDLYYQLQTNTPATASYIYDHIVLSRILGLPRDSELANQLGWFGGSSLITKLVAQIADENLLPSEQLGLGGSESVRGYDERAVNGDEGILFSEEYRTPSFSLAKLFNGRESLWNDTTQLGVFFDYGDTFNVHKVGSGPASAQLESMGLGLHTLAGPDTNFRLDLNYGWQLRNVPGANARSQFGHISIIVAY